MVNESSRWREPEPGAGQPETIRATFDWAETDPSTAVVEAVAIALDEDPTSIESLARRLDPDALDSIVGSERTDEERMVTVSFTYADRSVTVDATGVVVVRPVNVG